MNNIKELIQSSLSVILVLLVAMSVALLVAILVPILVPVCVVAIVLLIAWLWFNGGPRVRSDFMRRKQRDYPEDFR